MSIEPHTQPIYIEKRTKVFRFMILVKLYLLLIFYMYDDLLNKRLYRRAKMNSKFDDFKILVKLCLLF